jgi:hypothetical protein
MDSLKADVGSWMLDVGKTRLPPLELAAAR